MNGPEHPKRSRDHRDYRLEPLEVPRLDFLGPLRERPHPRDPRRDPRLRNSLLSNCKPVKRTLVELPSADYSQLLRALPFTVAFNFRPASLPNARDPRRARALERCGYPDRTDGPATLCEPKALVVDEEKTCPVLMIDSSKWPRLKRFSIEFWPHERNVARALHELRVERTKSFNASDNISEGLGVERWSESYRTVKKTSFAETNNRAAIRLRSLDLVDLFGEDDDDDDDNDNNNNNNNNDNNDNDNDNNDNDNDIDNDDNDDNDNNGNNGNDNDNDNGNNGDDDDDGDDSVDMLVGEKKGKIDQVPGQAMSSSSVREIVMLDDDVQLVKTCWNPAIPMAYKRRARQLPLALEVMDCCEDIRNDQLALELRPTVAKGEEDSPGVSIIGAAVTEETTNFTGISNDDDREKSAHGQSGLPLSVVFEVHDDAPRERDGNEKGTRAIETRKIQLWEHLQRSLAAFELLKDHRVIKCRENETPATIDNSRHNYHVLSLLMQHVKKFNITWSCMNYFLTHYQNLTLSQFFQANCYILRNNALSLQRYNPRYEKENRVTENGTETKGCDFDKILSTKSSHSITNDDERITLHKEYPLKKSYNIESANVFKNFLSKPVIENAAKNTVENLQLNLVTPDSTEEISSIKQNFLYSTISDSNHNELSNNIFINHKVKKRNSLSEPTTPQPYKCIKRFRSKSSDLSTNKKDSKSILSIKLTLIRDKSNQKNWINLENMKTTTSTESNIDNANVRRNEYIKENTVNEITPTQNMYVPPIQIVNKEVPELEENNFENGPVININNLENCLSPFLKSLVKKRSSSLRDVINMDSDCNSLCKRRKFSDYSTVDIQQKNNNCIDLVKSSLENNLQVKESLLQSKLSNDYSKKLLPKMDPCFLNPYNFLDNNDNNENISMDENVHANITLSLSPSLKNIVSASLLTSNESEFLELSKNNYAASRKKHTDSVNEDFSDHNSETCLEVVVPKIIPDESTEFDCNIQVDHNCNIEKNVEKTDKPLYEISKKFDTTIDENEKVDSLGDQEYIINKNCQRMASDVLQIKTISETSNVTSLTQISSETKTITKNLEFQLLKDNQLNILPEENQLILQFDEFCKNNDTELQTSNENINNSTINIDEANKSKEVMTKTGNEPFKVTLLKEYMEQVQSDNTDNELHNKNKSSINLKLNINKECKESNKDNKIACEPENGLKCNMNTLENKNMTINLKEIDINQMENNTCVTDIQTTEMYKDQDRSNTNSPDSQEMCIIDIVDSPLNRDQVLPDSTGLDEHLEGGDFDFLTSIKKIKHNSDSDNEYDVNSDSDVEINDHESIDSINMENTDENINLINKMTIESTASKTNEYQKSTNSIKAINLQETFNSSNTHCLKKLPNFYNECITKVVNNKAKIDDITNIDISGLNLYISDDIDDNITVMEHIKSNFTFKKNIKKIQHEKMKPKISSNPHDKKTDKLTNVTSIEKEKKLFINEQQVVKQLEKGKREGVQIEDMIISLCEQYDKQHILKPTVEDNSILPVNELVSSSSESCKNISSELTSVINKNIVPNNNSQINLSRFNNCSKGSTSKSSSKSSNSQSTIRDKSNEKNKNEVYNEDLLNNKTIMKHSNDLISNLNNAFNNTNILAEIPKENVFKEATATDQLNVKVSVIYPNSNLQATFLNSGIKSCTTNTDSSIKNLENQVSVIKNTPSIDNLSSPIIFEVSVPSSGAQSENDYDLLKNININLVDEIDVIKDTSMIHSSTSNLPEKTFKLRDINELLEKPGKLSNPKRVTSKNKNSTDKFIKPRILSDVASSNIRFLPEFISDVDKNNLSTTNCSDKFKALTNLINNIGAMPLSQLETIGCNLEQPIPSSKITNISNTIPVTKDNSNCNMPLSYQHICNVLPCSSYSVSKPSISQALENDSQNNCPLFNNNSQSTVAYPSANMNGSNRKVVLASSIYSNLYAQDTVFTLDLPPLETLAILIPYIVNIQESSDSINKKIIKYKKMLLNKLIYELKALDKILLHKRKQYINALLNFNTLTENTWRFQLIVITIIQCIFSLTNLTTKVNYHKVMQAIVNSINSKPSNQLLNTLNSILKLYYYFKQKGINCGYSDRRQPLLLELEQMNNKHQSNTVHTIMTDLQKREFITQTKIYCKINQIHALQLQVPPCDHNFHFDYQKVDEIDSSIIIPLQQNATTPNNSIEIMNSLQDSSLKNKIPISSMSDTTIEAPYQKKSSNSLINSKSIPSSNDAANTVDKESENEAVNETFLEEKEYNISHLCLKCKKLSQVVCSNCKIATYCSRDCQQNHWKETHYKICKKI